jgi:drug/metabolite transporter (DMT)-like permease
MNRSSRVAAALILAFSLAPAAFAWGLQRSGATSGSLLLNFEAVFTAALAFRLFAEPVGARFLAALALMATGGAVLTIDGARQAELHPLGLLAVVFATWCWALDNTLTRNLSEEPPFAVIACKSALGAGLALVLGRGLSEAAPRTALQYLLLLLVGAVGYGLSLRLYLEGQARIGAARSGGRDQAELRRLLGSGHRGFLW